MFDSKMKIATAIAVFLYAALFVVLFTFNNDIMNIDLSEYRQMDMIKLSFIPTATYYEIIYTVQGFFKFLTAFVTHFATRKSFELLLVMSVQLIAIMGCIGFASIIIYDAMKRSKWFILILPFSFVPMMCFSIPTNLILYSLE